MGMSERKRSVPEAGEPSFPAGRGLEKSAPPKSVRNLRDDVRARARPTTQPKIGRPKKGPEINQEQEQILRKDQVYLLFEAKRPMLWTVAGIRGEKAHDGPRRWIVAVHLRSPTGFEGYLGDLVYDGVRITELTDLELMHERARQIAADPEGVRQWNEYRASTLPAGEA